MNKDEIIDLIGIIMVILFSMVVISALIFGLYKFYEMIFTFIYKVASGVYHLLDKLISKI